jgi:hypothetical protein
VPNGLARLRARSPRSAVVVISALSTQRSMLAAVTDALGETIRRVALPPDRPPQAPTAEAPSNSRAPSLERLRDEAAQASERLTLYRHKTLLGGGDHRVLAERKRVSRAATDRLRRASQGTPSLEA